MQLDDCLAILSRGCGDSTESTIAALVDRLVSGRKDECVLHLLSYRNCHEVLGTLLALLKTPNLRVAGNAAYVIGLLAETELGRLRLMQGNDKYCNFLNDLVELLSCRDDEAVLNAGGALGTLADTDECRNCLLGQKEESNRGVTRLALLLTSKYSWISSNAALVFARLSSTEEGCSALFAHCDWSLFVGHLIASLGGESLGSGTNAAIALGRFVDVECTRNQLIRTSHIEAMVAGLGKMLCSGECNVKRNACYALSCLVSSKEGQEKFLQHPSSPEMLESVASLINSHDREASQFAMTTLYLLVSNVYGKAKASSISAVEMNLEEFYHNSSACGNLKEQVVAILQLLVYLPKPSCPIIQSTDPYTITASWASCNTSTSLFPINYELWQETGIVYSGTDCNYTLSGLKPTTAYVFKLRLRLGENVSEFSQETKVVTAKAAPRAPQNFGITGKTQTQVKLSWEPPEVVIGSLKGYKILVDDMQFLCKPAKSKSCIVPGLESGSIHQFGIVAITTKGDSDVASVVGGPLDAGDHCPSKPHVTVLGRREVFLSWSPPVQPLGRTMKYELKQNGQVIYSGVDLQYKCQRLTPHTEYAFTVSAVTTEGRFESPPTKKRTAQDFCLTRVNLIHRRSKTNSRLASIEGEDQLHSGIKSGSQPHVSKNLQSRSALLSSLWSTHLQTSCTDLSATEAKVDSRPLSRARSFSFNNMGRTTRQKTTPIGNHHRLRSLQKGQRSKLTSASRTDRNHQEQPTAQQHPHCKQNRRTPDVIHVDIRLAEHTHEARPRSTMTHEQPKRPTLATLQKQSCDRLVQSCVTLVTNVTCLPQAASGDDQLQTGHEKKPRTMTNRPKDTYCTHPPIERKQQKYPQILSHSSRPTQAVQAGTQKWTQTQSGRFKVIACDSAPFALASTHIPRPLPFHLRKQHQHRVHIQQQHLPLNQHHNLMSLRNTVNSRQHQPVPLTVRDVLWGMRRSGLAINRPLTPAQAKSCI
ncbi:uncharacterized protein LOC134191421 isoform X2 [Corticium candelabrum]|uniref:uncharacterized protein LOC134191421 isoform X2 n=1 Tax=Corticium candelabrum TaxID=121492 RepID=UPI002E25558E|nr:uncharacterized protein LOC134191421 isoform X2 [Corticium candelabrum]